MKQTRSVVPKTIATTSTSSVLSLSLYVGLVTTIISIASNLDLDAFNYIELLKRLLFFVVILFGMIICCARSSTSFDTDERPAPFLIYAMLAGLFGFILHNLVDFAWFDAGPTMLFALIAGSLLGLRHASVAGKRAHTSIAIGALSVLFLGMMAYGAFIVAPIATAESKAFEAQEMARKGLYESASTKYQSALQSCPVSNADYAAEAANSLLRNPNKTAINDNEALAMLNIAVASDPANFVWRLQRVQLLIHSPNQPSQSELIRQDYDMILKLNPIDANIRLEYAQWLDAMQLRADAVKQYKLTLENNDKLIPDEPRRLPQARIDQIKNRIQLLGN